MKTSRAPRAHRARPALASLLATVVVGLTLVGSAAPAHAGTPVNLNLLRTVFLDGAPRATADITVSVDDAVPTVVSLADGASTDLTIESGLPVTIDRPGRERGRTYRVSCDGDTLFEFGDAPLTFLAPDGEDLSCEVRESAERVVTVSKEVDPAGTGGGQAFGFSLAGTSPEGPVSENFTLLEGEEQTFYFTTGTMLDLVETAPGWDTVHGCTFFDGESTTQLSTGGPAATLDLTNRGADCVFTNTPSGETTGTLVVELDQVAVNGIRGVDYPFTGPEGPFVLESNGVESASFEVEAGTYTVTEDPPDRWLASFSCTDGSSGATTVNVSVAVGETVTCMATNRRIYTLEIERSLNVGQYEYIGEPDPQLIPADVTVSIDGAPPTTYPIRGNVTGDVIQVDVATGSEITIDRPGQERGWTYAVLCSRDLQGPPPLTIPAFSWRCEVYEESQRVLRVEKEVDPAGTGLGQRFGFAIVGTAPDGPVSENFSLAEGEGRSFVLPEGAVVDVVESTPGWAATSTCLIDNGDGGFYDGPSGDETVRVDFGDQPGAICTFTNTRSTDPTPTTTTTTPTTTTTTTTTSTVPATTTSTVPATTTSTVPVTTTSTVPVTTTSTVPVTTTSTVPATTTTTSTTTAPLTLPGVTGPLTSGPPSGPAAPTPPGPVPGPGTMAPPSPPPSPAPGPSSLFAGFDSPTPQITSPSSPSSATSAAGLLAPPAPVNRALPVGPVTPAVPATPAGPVSSATPAGPTVADVVPDVPPSPADGTPASTNEDTPPETREPDEPAVIGPALDPVTIGRGGSVEVDVPCDSELALVDGDGVPVDTAALAVGMVRVSVLCGGNELGQVDLTVVEQTATSGGTVAAASTLAVLIGLSALVSVATPARAGGTGRGPDEDDGSGPRLDDAAAPV